MTPQDPAPPPRAARKAAAKGKPSAATAKGHACCGAKYSKHKKGCAKADGKLPPEEEYDGSEKTFKCIDCDEVVKTRQSLGAVKAEGCPACGKRNFIQKQ